MSTAQRPRFPAAEAQSPARIPASDLKQKGWRGVMKTVRQQGAVMVTNHNEPEAVILGVEEYESLIKAAGHREREMAADLDALRRRFDERLAVLHEDDAAERLRAAMRKPVKLQGKVRAGSGF
jgi:prevent-host-death family protein